MYKNIYGKPCGETEHPILPLIQQEQEHTTTLLFLHPCLSLNEVFNQPWRTVTFLTTQEVPASLCPLGLSQDKERPFTTTW